MFTNKFRNNKEQYQIDFDTLKQTILSCAQIDKDLVDKVSNKDFDTEPSPVSDTATLGFRLIHRSIKRCFPDVVVSPYLVLGATDSRFFSLVSKNVYRFMPVRLNDEDLKRPHGTNERISTTDFKNVVRFYVELIKGS
jgi:carboxypeptidase PM20D1